MPPQRKLSRSTYAYVLTAPSPPPWTRELGAIASLKSKLKYHCQGATLRRNKIIETESLEIAATESWPYFSLWVDRGLDPFLRSFVRRNFGSSQSMEGSRRRVLLYRASSVGGPSFLPSFRASIHRPSIARVPVSRFSHAMLACSLVGQLASFPRPTDRPTDRPSSSPPGLLLRPPSVTPCSIPALPRSVLPPSVPTSPPLHALIPFPQPSSILPTYLPPSVAFTLRPPAGRQDSGVTRALKQALPQAISRAREDAGRG